MVAKPKHLPKYTPERIKEIVDHMAAICLRWLISVNSRVPNKTEKTVGRLSSRLAKVKDWPKNYRG